MLRFFALGPAVLFLVLGLAVVACGDDDDDDDGGGAATGTTVKTTLSDFKIDLASDSGPAGSFTFELTNNDPEEHEFVIFKTDLAADKLPVTDDKVPEETEGLNLIDEEEGIPKGESRTLTVDLEAGKYVLICNLLTHYGQGMHAAFTVN
jgi:uncharacterized cupredoxin-like copper-binding protein